MTVSQVKFSELPEFIRVKLTEEGKKEFWHRINEFGGVKNFCEAFEYSSSTVYNWKNKDCFIPVETVRSVFGVEASEEVKAFKGEGRSLPVKNPEFPLIIDNKLLTRIDLSVNVNSNGIPVYQSKDEGLVKRFNQLLNEFGDVPVEVYKRSVYELRYPKYLQQIFSQVNYKQKFAASVDEKGQIKNGKLVYKDKQVLIENFEGELYSRDKTLQLALARNDEEKIRQIMAEEADRVSNAVNQN